MSQGTRKKELSLLNLLFCILVVLIHCLSQPVSVLDRSSWQYALVLCVQRLAFVSVPGFFFLSGLKLTLFADRHRSLVKYWLGRVRTILLPYILAVAIYYLYFWTHHYFPFSLADFWGYLVRGDLSSHFYFVVTLVQFMVLTPVFLWLARRFDPVVLLPFALGLTWLSSLYLQAILTSAVPGVTFPYGDRVFVSYLIYYLAGCCAGQSYSKFLALDGGRFPIWSWSTPCTFSALFCCCFCWLPGTGLPCPACGRRWTGPVTSSTCTTVWSLSSSMTR